MTFFVVGSVKICDHSCVLRSLAQVQTKHVFVKLGCPLRQQSQNMAKMSKSYIFTHPTPGAWDVREV